jgi:NitT/TauT family transport system substrate-binding protein
MNIRLFAVLAFCLAAMPALGDPIKLRLAQNLSPISGVAIVAKQKGFFEKYGLDVTVSNFTSGRQALESVMGGGADIATTAEAPTTAAAMAKQKIAFLCRMEYSDLKTLTDASDKIAAFADLKGKKIAYTAGTGSEVYTMSLLKQAGLSKGDVTLVNLRPQDMAPALSAGSIDVMNTWEPHIANAKKALPGKVRELETKGIYAETFNIVTTQDYLAAKKDAVTGFLRALIDAEKWMKANRDDAIAVVAGTVGMKREDLASLWNDFIYEVVLDQKTLDVLTAHAQWRLETGNAPTGATMPDFSQVIFAGPLKAIAPERVRIPSP